MSTDDGGWTSYWRQMFEPERQRPSAFANWKVRSTGVNIARQLWEARARARDRWLPAPPGIAHPPVVLWLPNIAHAACLTCTWINSEAGGDLVTAGRLAREHAIAEGADPTIVNETPVPISARNGPIDDPLTIETV